MNFKVQLPQNAGNHISEVLDFKISRGRIPPDPPTSARFSASVNKTTGSAPDATDIVTDSDKSVNLKTVAVSPGLTEDEIMRVVTSTMDDFRVEYGE
jgi:hypothetical protein